MTMRYTAEIDGDLVSQSHAWNGLAHIHYNQGDFTAMLNAATQSEQVAWLVGADAELTQALLYKGEAHLYLGDVELAAAAANRALTISDRQHNMTATTENLALLSRIYIKSGRQNRAMLYLDEMADQLDLQDLDPNVVAHNRAQRGQLYRSLEQYDKAGHELIAALDLYRELDAQAEIAATLNQVAELARLRGSIEAAIPFYQDALDIAKAIGDDLAALTYRTNLAGALIAGGQLEEALSNLQQVLALAENVSLVVKWVKRYQVYRYLAEIYLRQDELKLALESAHRALNLTPKFGETAVQGTIWRLLGQIAERKNENVQVDNQSYNAADCFAESLKLLQGLGTKRQQVLTLRAWAAYETGQGNPAQAQNLTHQAAAIASQLDMKLAV
ncbi:MAG: tetratricopeptide repeat protein [Anaerolineae bacterium]